MCFLKGGLTIHGFHLQQLTHLFLKAFSPGQSIHIGLLGRLGRNRTNTIKQNLKIQKPSPIWHGESIGLGWVGSRPRLVAYPRSAPPSLRDPTGRPYPGVRSQGLPDC